MYMYIRMNDFVIASVRRGGTRRTSGSQASLMYVFKFVSMQYSAYVCVSVLDVKKPQSSFGSSNGSHRNLGTCGCVIDYSI